MGQEVIVNFRWTKETFPDKISMTVEGFGFTLEGKSEADVMAEFDAILIELKDYADSQGSDVFWNFLAERGIQVTPIEESRPVTPALRMDKVLVP